MKHNTPTRYKNLDKAFAGFTVVCARAAVGNYRGALIQLGAMPPMPPAAALLRDALNTVLGELVPCKHNPRPDGEICSQCGWRYPSVASEAAGEEETEAQAADVDTTADGAPAR